jgi:hypothetical protein
MSTARVRRVEAAHTSRMPRFSSPHVPHALKGTTLARHNGRVENYVDSLVESFKVRPMRVLLLPSLRITACVAGVCSTRGHWCDSGQGGSYTAARYTQRGV